MNEELIDLEKEMTSLKKYYQDLKENYKFFD